MRRHQHSRPEHPLRHFFQNRDKTKPFKGHRELFHHVHKLIQKAKDRQQ